MPSTCGFLRIHGGSTKALAPYGILLDTRTMSVSNSEPEVTVAGPPEDRVRAAVMVLLRLRRVLEHADIELTLPQYHLLAMVGTGGERSAHLADKLAVRRPTVTASADALVAAGLLEREAEAGDRRVVRLRITEAGQAALERSEAELAGAVGPLIAESGDPERLLDLLDAVGTALNRRAVGRHGHQT